MKFLEGTSEHQTFHAGLAQCNLLVSALEDLKKHISSELKKRPLQGCCEGAFQLQ